MAVRGRVTLFLYLTDKTPKTSLWQPQLAESQQEGHAEP